MHISSSVLLALAAVAAAVPYKAPSSSYEKEAYKAPSSSYEKPAYKAPAPAPSSSYEKEESYGYSAPSSDYGYKAPAPAPSSDYGYSAPAPAPAPAYGNDDDSYGSDGYGSSSDDGGYGSDDGSDSDSGSDYGSDDDNYQEAGPAAPATDAAKPKLVRRGHHDRYHSDSHWGRSYHDDDHHHHSGGNRFWRRDWDDHRDGGWGGNSWGNHFDEAGAKDAADEVETEEAPKKSSTKKAAKLQRRWESDWGHNDFRGGGGNWGHNDFRGGWGGNHLDEAGAKDVADEVEEAPKRTTAVKKLPKKAAPKKEDVEA